MDCCSRAELELKGRFETAYARAMAPVMLQIERQVCGGDYGGNSWTTKKQADILPELLGLRANSQLLDLGAGTGWPGLYLSKITGCRTTLVDLPEVGLKIAKDRAISDGMVDRVSIHTADAAALPFEDASFDAINHCDLLCCLVKKRETLLECRRVLRPLGSMVFSVISIAPGISKAQYQVALENAPEFAEIEHSYEELIERTGWRIEAVADLTEEYLESCARQVEADGEYQNELVALLGEQQSAERMRNWKRKLEAIQDGLFLRQLFTCRRP